MTSLEERIYVAKTNMNISFKQLAYLFQMERDEIAEIYSQEEERRRKMNAITIKAAPWDCIKFTERTKNLLKRRGINTIGKLIKLKKPADLIWRGVGPATEVEILEAASRARKEIESR